MTLGVAYAINQCLVVMGDLLESGPEREHDVFIPSLGNVQKAFAKGAGYSIIGLAQKVIVICKDMAITWAGSKVAATFAIGELRALVAHGLTPARVQAFLQRLPMELKTLELQLAGWFVHENTAYHIDFDVSEIASDRCDNLRVIGSGAPIFQKLLADYQWVSGACRGIEAERGAALGTSFAFIGMLLELELKNNRRSLHHYFGGGYEVVLGEAGAFRKLDDVTYIYWNIQVSDNGVGITLPFHIQKQCFRDGRLMILPARFEECEGQSGYVWNELYVATEPGSTLAPERVSDDALPSFNSQYTCHYFIQGEAAQVFTRVQYRERPEDNDLTIVDAGPSLQVTFNRAYMDAIFATVQNDPRWQPQT